MEERRYSATAEWCSKRPTVVTKSGEVAGFNVKCAKGVARVFLGIPFAKPPIGERRFRKTEAVEPWKGVLKCLRYRSRAPQNDFIWDRLELGVGQSEDCLYLNVIAPGWKTTSDELQPGGFPVLVFIHGGGFVVDSAVKYHYRHIAKKLTIHNVIVITIQYRLGFLGYFTTGDYHCPGNFGLWDQATALRWIRDNVASFGGDPQRITVAGQSAGAASADLLALSPHSRDLFDQLILMSGNAECAWAVRDKTLIVDYCRKHVEKLGWKGSNNEELMKWLRKLDASKLRDRFIGNSIIFNTASLPLAPVFDGDFLPRSIDQLRRETAPKPTIVGVTEHEGLLFVAVGRLACNKNDVKRGLDVLTACASESSIPKVADVIRNVYVPNPSVLEERKKTRMAFVTILDDVVGNYGCALYARKQTERGGKVFMYSLEHCNPMSYGILAFFVPFVAATHSAELIYLFNANVLISKFRKNAVDRRIASEITRRWISFVKRRDPNVVEEESEETLFPEWSAVDSANLERHLRIGDVSEMTDEFREGRMRRLRRIFGDKPMGI